MFCGDYQQVKLIDFGVSNFVLETIQSSKANQGTIRYMSPEQMNETVTFKIDIWAFGCVLLQFATGLKPYFGIKQNEGAQMQLLFNKTTPLDYALAENYEGCKVILDNPDFLSLLQKCFTFDYSDRPTALEVIAHPFFRKHDEDYLILTQNQYNILQHKLLNVITQKVIEENKSLKS